MASGCRQGGSGLRAASVGNEHFTEEIGKNWPVNSRKARKVAIFCPAEQILDISFVAWRAAVKWAGFHGTAGNSSTKRNPPMNDRDQRRYDRLTRVQTFGRENAAEFAAGSKAKTHFAAIDGLLVEIDDAKAGQQPARVSKETLLDALTLDFKDIVRTARAIALTENGFASPYRIPDNPSEAAIVTHADALLARLEDNNAPVADGGDTAEQKTAKATLRARFTAYEMAADFVADLRADRKAIADANKLNQGETQEGVENTALIGQLLEKAGKDVQELDAIMNNKYSRQPEKLRAWQSASRIERAPQREKKAEPPAPPTGGTTPPKPPGT